MTVCGDFLVFFLSNDGNINLAISNNIINM